MTSTEICCSSSNEANNLIHKINSFYPETLYATLMFDDRNYVKIQGQRHYLMQRHFYDKALLQVLKSILPSFAVQVLNLSYHEFFLKQTDALATLLGCSPLKETLTHLILIRCTMNEKTLQTIISRLPQLTKLISLNLDRVFLPESAHYLAAVLPYCPVLLELRLQNNKIDDMGVIQLLKALCYNETDVALQTLDLGCNLIGDVGASVIAEMMTSNRQWHLWHLDLDNNMFTSAGLLELAWAISVNTTLLSLNLQSYHYTTLIEDVLYNALSHNKTMIKFDDGSYLNDTIGLVPFYMQRNQVLRAQEFWRPYQPRGTFTYTEPLVWTTLLCNRHLAEPLPMDMCLTIFSFFVRSPELIVEAIEVVEVDD